MTVIRAFFPKIRALFSNFRKRAGEIFLLHPPLVTRLTLIRLICLFLRFEERKRLVNTFAMSNFNYCFLIQNFSSSQSLNKIENLQKTALRFLLNDYGSTYKDLLGKSGCPNINLRTQRTLCIEIQRTLNELNPGVLQEQHF